MPAGHVRDYVPEVSSLLAALTAAGFTVNAINNGDGFIPAARVGDLTAQLTEITACDDCQVQLLCPDQILRTLYLVYGNSPGELVCDYHCGSSALDTVIQTEGAKWETKRQPTKFCQYQADRDAFNARARARQTDCTIPLDDRLNS